MHIANLKTLGAGIALAALAQACATAPMQQEASAESVIDHYADMAYAKYSDSLTTAQALDASITEFLATPNAMTLDQAQQAWLASRVPYQ